MQELIFLVATADHGATLYEVAGGKLLAAAAVLLLVTVLRRLPANDKKQEVL
jgi:hypothetical protein